MEGCFEPQISSDEGNSGHSGCTHYKRGCKIRAPCCDEIFDCRHCHNESKNSMEISPIDRHDVPRHELRRVICSSCDTEQDVQQNCAHCGVCMGKYFCSKCKFFDDDVTKNQFHCDGCGICRTGGEDNSFHCEKCGCCYNIMLKNSHNCVERAMHHNCPVCFEYIFDTMKDITVLPCGHTIHLGCLKEMEQHFQFSCPVCSKSYCDMSRVWERLDQEVASTPMPEIYQNKLVWILCNDCGKTSEVNYHIVAHKCLSCNSYNTRQTQGRSSSCSSSIGEETVSYKPDPIQRRQPKVTNPTQARAIDFFYLAKNLWHEDENGYKWIHCGNTAITFPLKWESYFQVEGAQSDSMEDYLEQIEAGKFLSLEGKQYLFETFMTWDAEYATIMINKLEDAEDHHGWENQVGDEGLQNIMME